MATENSGDPFLSVVIPAYNEEEIIEECLDSVLNQIEPPTYEVVVVDDGSADRTPTILDTYSDRHENVRVLHNETNRGIVPTFNRGCEAARGEFLCFTGADTLLDEHYLQRVTEYATNGYDLILGYVKVRNTDHFHPLASQLAKEYDEEYKYGGAAMSVRRDLFLETGAFKGAEGTVHQGEGQELIQRAEDRDWTIVRDDDIVVYSEFPTSLHEVLQRKAWAGYMYITYTYEHPDEISLLRRLAGAGYFGVTTILALATLLVPILAVLSVPLLGVFLYYTYPRAVDMYERSGKPSYFFLRFGYDYLAGCLRLAGYAMAWRKVLGIGMKKVRKATTGSYA